MVIVIFQENRNVFNRRVHDEAFYLIQNEDMPDFQSFSTPLLHKKVQ